MRYKVKILYFIALLCFSLFIFQHSVLSSAPKDLQNCPQGLYGRLCYSHGFSNLDINRSSSDVSSQVLGLRPDATSPLGPAIPPSVGRLDNSSFLMNNDSSFADNHNNGRLQRHKRQASPMDAGYFPSQVSALGLNDTVQFLYTQPFYFSSHSTKVSFELPFNDILSSLLSLYRFLTELNSFSELDSLDYTAVQQKSASGTLLNSYRLYHDVDTFAEQTSICSRLNLSHVSPLFIKSSMVPNTEYFLPFELLIMNHEIVCKLSSSTLTGKACTDRLTDFAKSNRLLNDFGGSRALYDHLVQGDPKMLYVTVSLQSVRLVNTSFAASICCKGTSDKENDSVYLFLRLFGNEYYSRLSVLYLTLTDTLFAHYLSLEEVFFNALPETLINNDVPVDKDKIIRSLQGYLPAPLPSYSARPETSISPHTKRILKELFLPDLPLMQFFSSLHSASYHFWDSHSLPSLYRIHFALKSLFLGMRTSFEFFSADSPAAPIRFSLPFQTLIDVNTSPDSYSIHINQQTMRTLPGRELIFLYTLLHNQLTECLVHIRHDLLGRSLPDSQILSLAAILGDHHVTPPKRSTPLIYPSPPSFSTVPPTDTSFTEPPSPSPPSQAPLPTVDFDTLKRQTLHARASPGLNFTQLPRPVFPNRRKRNTWGSFWSSALSLPSSDEIHDLQNSERTLFNREMQVQTNVQNLAKSTDTLQKTIDQFRSQFNANTLRTSKVESELLSIISDEERLAERLKDLGHSLDAAVQTSVSFIQVNGALVQLVHHISSLSSSVSSLYTQQLPVHLLTDNKLTDLLPVYTSVSTAHALIRPSLRDSLHAMDVTFPVVSDYFLAYQIMTIPFLPVLVDPSDNPISHQIRFPFDFVAISPLQRYFTYDVPPCSTKKGSTLCFPTDISILQTNGTCFRSFRSLSFQKCQGKLTVRARYRTRPTYIYTSNRNNVLVFLSRSENATYTCKSRHDVRRTPLPLSAGLTKVKLPYGCEISTSRLFIPSASVLPPRNQTLTFASQGDHFADTLLSFHSELNAMHDLNISHLISDVRKFNISLGSVPVEQLPDIIADHKTIDTIRNLSPFSPTVFDSGDGVNWIQIIFIVTLIIILCVFVNCIHCLCPGLFKALWESLRELCCALCCFFCRTRARSNASPVQAPLVCATPASGWTTPAPPPCPASPRPPARPPAYQLNDAFAMSAFPMAVVSTPSGISTPAPSGILTQAPSRRNSLSYVFQRTFNRKSFEAPTPTWIIVSFEKRLRLRATYKNTALYFNTIQKKICSDLDVPFTHDIISILPAPNLKLLSTYEERVRSLPAPDYVLKNGDFFHGSPPYYYKWCPDSHHWIDACSELPVDGLRAPIP